MTTATIPTTAESRLFSAVLDALDEPECMRLIKLTGEHAAHLMVTKGLGLEGASLEAIRDVADHVRRQVGSFGAGTTLPGMEKPVLMHMACGCLEPSRSRESALPVGSEVDCENGHGTTTITRIADLDEGEEVKS